MSTFTNLIAGTLIKMQKSKVEDFLNKMAPMQDAIKEGDLKINEFLLLLKPVIRWIIESETERMIIFGGNPYYFKYIKSECKISRSTDGYSYEISEEIDGKVKKSKKWVDKKTIDSLLATGFVREFEVDRYDNSMLDVPAQLLNELRNAPFIDYGNELNFDEYNEKNREWLSKEAGKIAELYNSENYQILINKLNGFISLFPPFWYFYYLKGMSYMYLEDNECALVNFYLALDYSEDELEVLKFRQIIFTNLGARNLAIKDLEKIILKEPNDLTINTLLGTIYFQVRDYKNAIKYLSIAESLNPNLETDEILQTLKLEAENLISIRKKYPENFTELHFIVILTATCLFATAQNDSVQLLQNDKDFGTKFGNFAYNLVSILGIDIDSASFVGEALPYAISAIKGKSDFGTDIMLEIMSEVQNYPKYIKKACLSGLIRLKRELLPNKSDKLIRILCEKYGVDYKIAENNSKQGFPYEFQSKADKAFDDNELQTAKQYYRKVIELSPSYFDAYYRLLDVYLDENDRQESITYMVEGLKIDFENYDLHLLLGWERLFLGEIEKAYLNFKVCLSIDADFISAMVYLGGVKILQGDSKSAISILSSAIEKPDDNELTADALYYRGLAYSNLKNIKNSNSDLEEASRLGFNPKDDPIEKIFRKAYTNSLSQSNIISNNIPGINPENTSQGVAKLKTKTNCTECRKELDGESKFCSECGTKVLNDKGIDEHNMLNKTTNSETAKLMEKKGENEIKQATPTNIDTGIQIQIHNLIVSAIKEQLNRNISKAEYYLKEAAKLGSKEAETRLTTLKFKK